MDDFTRFMTLNSGITRPARTRVAAPNYQTFVLLRVERAHCEAVAEFTESKTQPIPKFDFSDLAK